MSFIRRAFWPAAFALGMLIFLGVIGTGSGVQTAQADDGDFCSIIGPRTILVGQTYLYVGVYDSSTEHGTSVSVDNIIGNSRITSAVKHWDKYDKINPSNFIAELDNNSAYELSDDVQDDLAAGFTQAGLPGSGIVLQQTSPTTPANEPGAFDTFKIQNTCGTSSLNALTRLYQDAILNGQVCVVVTSGTLASNVTGSCLLFDQLGTSCISTTAASSCFNGPATLYGDYDIDCPTGATCVIATAVITAVVAAIAADLASGQEECARYADDAAKAAIGAGASQLVAQQFGDFTFQLCQASFDVDNFPNGTFQGLFGFHGDDAFLDSFVIVDVTCFAAGNFDITFTDSGDEGDAISQSVRCLGNPSSRSTVTPNPASVEIVPAPGNVSNSLITVVLLDSDGNQAFAKDVDFTTDRCSIETASIDTVAEWNAIAPIFAGINVNVPSTAAAVQASLAATTQPDSSRTAESTIPLDLGTRSVAGTILMCDPLAAPNATPGVANITVIIDVVNGDDIILTTRVTVVGPPASITVAASPTTLRCGEKSTITATIKDAIGQNVSEHTRVEAVTNSGGTLAGSGAVANQAGLVSPLSSTVSETFTGVSTIFLLTSEQHSGPYEVVVTTGGTGALGNALGGVFSTAPISAQVTVTCSIPAVAAPAVAVPTVTAPRTGTGGITPPNTGEAGLAASNGTSWTLFAAAGVFAISLGLGVVLKKKSNN